MYQFFINNIPSLFGLQETGVLRISVDCKTISEPTLLEPETRQDFLTGPRLGSFKKTLPRLASPSFVW